MSNESLGYRPRAWIRVLWADKVQICYEVVYKARLVCVFAERDEADECVRMFNLLVKESDDD